MGPHFFKCGSGIKGPVGASAGEASMGPHFFKCGSSVTRRIASGLSFASMGPHFFKCGSGNVSEKKRLRSGASMGPHFFKCGSFCNQNVPVLTILGFNGAALFQVRKYRYASRISSWENPLQWGRTFSSAEVDQLQCGLTPFVRLQWGRTFSSAEVDNP